MRTIRFRTWDTILKGFAEWTNRDPFFSTTDGKIFFWERTKKDDGSYGGDIILEDLGNRFVLQQFTGIQDKNGKDIYEGDIVKLDLHIGIITFFVENGCYTLTHPKYPFFRHDLYVYGNLLNEYKIDTRRIEILGNIFENPELLTE